ncbi:efflux RND transporter periplasmic adaptor subunit [Brevundimonas naejangsanensis]|uniref:Efflux RND transporter periplasmic adaptor subunit n=1 Tax=Brevundimonas naejangsanensis TaxID=588932 RepID=A0A494RHC5_9CAUL|nr:efflux RND transporter periplasmic adaptor subunit [Brevundimonas naejangsanensis]AYG95771.1 efflux RND transporter periplasmic adaptor subunit [Brevundimonas naejangsanensis]
MRISKKAAVVAAGGLLIGAGLIYVVQDTPFAQGAAAAPGTPTVPVAQVITREVAPAAEFTGSLASPEAVDLRPQVSGPIQSVSVPEGGFVRRGQLLFQLDSRPFQVALEAAQAQLLQAQAQLTQADADLGRAESLAPNGAVSVKSLETARSTQRERQAQVQAARAAVNAARLDLSYTRVTAPISGRVDRIMTTKGNVATAGATVLTTIVSVDPLQVYFDIDEATYLDFVARARPDSAGRTTAQLPVRIGLMNEEGYPHTGVLDFIGAQVHRGTGTVRARAVIANPEGRLAPGLFARIRLDTAAPQQAVLIDDQAVGSDQGQTYVLVLGTGNKVEYRAVSLGRVVDGLRVVESGLEPGETIVIKGLVRPGMQITPRRTSMQSPAAATAPAARAATPAAEAVR